MQINTVGKRTTGVAALPLMVTEQVWDETLPWKLIVLLLAAKEQIGATERMIAANFMGDSLLSNYINSINFDQVRRARRIAIINCLL